MKLKEALEMGWICGFKYVGESVDNFIRFDTIILPAEKIGDELDELNNEFESARVSDFTLIKDALMDLYGISTDDIDAKLERDLENCNNAD